MCQPCNIRVAKQIFHNANECRQSYSSITRSQNVLGQTKMLPMDAFTTLIDIGAYGMFPLSSPSCVATALESSWVITTGSVWIAHVRVLTLICITARFTIKGPPCERRTLASIGPWRIYASCRWQTVMGTSNTFISIFTRGRAIIPLVSQVADARTKCIVISGAVSVRPTYFAFYNGTCCKVTDSSSIAIDQWAQIPIV